MLRTSDPVVYIHGMWGWASKRPLWNFATPYWPETVFDDLNPNYLLLEVGAASSDHDRACEAFYQLLGGRVDYGEQHALENGHNRYGRTFTKGLYPKWNQNNPIHLVGHSYGANTAIELYQLICQDAFGVGSNHQWVQSITSIAGPLSGTTLINCIGVEPDDSIQRWSIGHFLALSCGAYLKLLHVIPWLSNLYDFRMEHWDFQTQWNNLAHDHPMHRSKDNVYHCLTVANRMKRNRTLKQMDKVYLFSVVCQSTPQRSLFLLIIRFLFYQLDLATAPIGALWRQKSKEPESDRWIANDGIVNTISMSHPLGSNQTYELDTGKEYKRGRWYIQEADKNHFCGTYGDRTAHDLYTRLFKALTSLNLN